MARMEKEVEMRAMRFVALVTVVLLLVAVPASAMVDGGVPIKGTVTGIDGMADPTGICDPIPSGSDFNDQWLYVHNGTGNLSHLGRVTIEIQHCSYIDWFTGAGMFRNGTMTFTAANGDQLVISQVGTFQLTPYPPVEGVEFLSVVDGEWTVVGGTGRFEGATGSGVLQAVGDLWAQPNQTTAHFAGMITYEASHRSQR